MASKSSVTSTAPAFVVRAKGVYFGLATKVSWPGPAFSIPSTPVISCSGSPWQVAPSTRASSASFMEGIVPDSFCLILLFEKALLGRFGRTAAGSGLDHRHYIQFRDRLPGQKNPLRVRPGVGWDQEQSIPLEQSHIVLRQALDQVVVLQPHPNPEALAAGAGDKGLAQQTFRLVDVPGLEVPHKADPYHFRHVNRNQFSRQIENFRLFLVNKGGRREVSGKPVPAQFAYDDLFAA